MKKLLPFLALIAIACKQQKQSADLFVKNARVYTVDNNFDTVSAFVVTGGKIIAVGKTDSLDNIYDAKQVVDAGGKAVCRTRTDRQTRTRAAGGPGGAIELRQEALIEL